MAARQQRQQVNVSLRKRFLARSWIIAICVVLVLSVIALVILWVLSQLGVLTKPWSTIIDATLGTLGGAIGAGLTAFTAIIVAVITAVGKDILHWLSPRSSFASSSPTKEETSLAPTLPMVNQQNAAAQQVSLLSGNSTNTSASLLPAGKEPPQSAHGPSELSIGNSSPAVEKTVLGGASSPWIPFRVEIYKSPPLRAIRSSPHSVFPFLEGLADPQELYGWGPLRSELLDCVQQGRPASIVGLRRMGKTWLLDYVRLEIAVEHQLGANYRVSYVDATSAECSTVHDFTASVLEQLGVCVSPENVPLNLNTLSKAIRELQRRQIVPVLCLDEFEGFSHHHQEFTRDFYTELRSLSKEGLGFVVASQHPLLDIVNEETRTSPFFNIFQQLALKPFDAKDAEAFAEAKSKQAGFTEQERAYLLKYGTKDGCHWPPIRLQLVGKQIFDAKKNAATEGPHYYRPDDLDYWRAFEKSLEDTYKAVVVS